MLVSKTAAPDPYRPATNLDNQQHRHGGGEGAAAAGKTDTFLGERYRRLARRRGKLKALVAIARSILVIVWHLLADRSTRYCDLGATYHASRIDKNRKMRNHIRQLETLGYTVTLTQAA